MEKLNKSIEKWGTIYNCLRVENKIIICILKLMKTSKKKNCGKILNKKTYDNFEWLQVEEVHYILRI